MIAYLDFQTSLLRCIVNLINLFFLDVFSQTELGDIGSFITTTCNCFLQCSRLVFNYRLKRPQYLTPKLWYRSHGAIDSALSSRRGSEMGICADFKVLMSASIESCLLKLDFVKSTHTDS